MQRYLRYLIEDLKIAESNPVKGLDFGSSYEEFEQMMHEIESDKRNDLKQILGVSYEELPPPEKLSVEQTQRLMIALLNAMSAQGTDVSFPGEGIPVGIAYGELREYLKEGSSVIPGWTIDFCSGWCPDCVFVDYCDTVSEVWGKDELEANKS